MTLRFRGGTASGHPTAHAARISALSSGISPISERGVRLAYRHAPARLVIRMTTENPTWGYTRFRARLERGPTETCTIDNPAKFAKPPSLGCGREGTDGFAGEAPQSALVVTHMLPTGYEANDRGAGGWYCRMPFLSER
jgi:hypothetical protein